MVLLRFAFLYYLGYNPISLPTENGSGSKSKVFEAEVQENCKTTIEKVKLFDALETCQAIDFTTYEKLHKKELKQSVIEPKNEFYLDYIKKENAVLVGARYFKFS